MYIRSFVFFVLVLLVLPALSFSSSGANLNPKETANAINAEIAKQNLGWVAGETSISILPVEQKEMLLMGKKAAPAGKKPSKMTAKSIGTPSPSSTDWRSKEGLDWVTPVRDQGGCGACWAFSSIAIMESKIRIELNNSNYGIDLAEQDVLSCNPFGSNCNGGLEVYALEHMRRNGTIPESCFPYVETRVACSGKCSGWQNEIVKVFNYTVLPADATAFKQTINEQGPITVWMAVYDDFFSYSSGVYQKARGSLRGYHSIAIVGYNDSGQYWIVKNSWGTGWGEDGYFRISYSENNLNSTDPGQAGVFYLDDSYSVTSTDINTVALTTNATAVNNDSIPYAFSTWTSSPYVNVTLSCLDGPGSRCGTTLYCTDTLSTCIPNLAYFAPVQISTQGTSYIRYFSNDTVGNSESVNNKTIMIDTAIPIVTIFSPVNITYNTWNISFKFNASASFWNLSSCWYSVDSGINLSAPCKNSSYIIWLLNGVHNITVYANDTNGFVGSSTVSPTINSTATINVTVAKSQLWTKSTFNFFYYNLTFREFKPANCSLINASNVTIAKSNPLLNGTYSFYANLPVGSPNGFYPYTILCYHPSITVFKDSKVVNVSFDNTVPKVTALFSGTWTNKPLVNVSYNATDNLADKIACNLTYGIKKFSANVTNNTIQAETVNLTAQGLNTISISCSDYAGNLAFASGTIGLDSIAPTITVTPLSLSSNANGTKNVYFFYSITEANTMNSTAYSIDSTINRSLGTTKSGSFIVPLFPGNHSIHIDSYDRVLNRGYIDKNFTVK